MDMRVLVVAALVWPQVSFGQVVGSRTAAGCIDTAEANAAVLVEGRLVTAMFTDDYGKERAYILELPKPTCIDDGGEFADPSAQFAQVQVAGTNSTTEGDLRKSVGRRIKVSGKAFAAHTRHHHRPMIVLVDRVMPAER
jgi:hypothetical protein